MRCFVRLNWPRYTTVWSSYLGCGGTSRMTRGSAARCKRREAGEIWPNQNQPERQGRGEGGREKHHSNSIRFRLRTSEIMKSACITFFKSAASPACWSRRVQQNGRRGPGKCKPIGIGPKGTVGGRGGEALFGGTLRIGLGKVKREKINQDFSRTMTRLAGWARKF